MRLPRLEASPEVRDAALETYRRAHNNAVELVADAQTLHQAGSQKTGREQRCSRLHHIGLGRGLTGTRVLVLVDDLRVRVLSEDGELIRELILDPTRDYQPHGRT